MKSLFGILLILFFSTTDGLISMKEKLQRISTSNLPFEETSKAPGVKPRFAVPEQQWQNLPIFTYYDLGLTKRNNYNEDVVIYRKFESEYNDYCIVALKIGVSDPEKDLLVTYDNEGNILDFLETGVYWWGVERLCVKQWKITSKREIIITWIKIESNTRLQFIDNFTSIKGQRFDTHYTIDSKGIFQKIKEVSFEPQSYTKTYLESDKNLWEGNESIKEEVSFD